MSTELNEARRRATELRSTLVTLEKNLSDVRHALGGGQDPSTLARRLGVQARGLTDAVDDMKSLSRLKPELIARIEQTETAIGIAQARVLELEAAEPTRRAEEVEKAKAALETLPRFARAGLEADQSLRAFVAANVELRAAAREMASLGHAIANPENMRIALGRIVETALSQIGGASVRSPGSSTFDAITALWSENARLRLEAIVRADTPSTQQLEEVA